MNNDKIKGVNMLSGIVKKLQNNKNTVGLITGCFDVIHIGHLALFEEAKNHVDILIIGVDNNESIKSSKGSNRPVNTAEDRMAFLSALSDVDYCFLIEDVYNFNDPDAQEILKKLTKKVNPNFLITNEKCDRYWQEKRSRAEKLNLEYLNLTPLRTHASSKIIERLLSEL